MPIKNSFIRVTYEWLNTFFMNLSLREKLSIGGERGIRTLDSVATIRAFQACSLTITGD